MAQWNPFFGVPNQSEYDEQNFHNVQYGTVPTPAYYFPNNYSPNYGGETVYNVQDLEAQHIRQSDTSDFRNKSDELLSHSKLTPTAAEFKPSSSTNFQLNSQTFYGKAQKSGDDITKGAIRKINGKKDELGEPPPIKNDVAQKSYAKNTTKYKKYDRNIQQKNDEIVNYVKSDNKFNKHENNSRNFKTEKSNSFYDNNSISKYIKRENYPRQTRTPSLEQHNFNQNEQNASKPHKLEYRDINFKNSNFKSFLLNEKGEPQNETEKGENRYQKPENQRNKYENRTNKYDSNSSRSEPRYNKYEKREYDESSRKENRYYKFENRDNYPQSDDNSARSDNRYQNENRFAKREHYSQNESEPKVEGGNRDSYSRNYRNIPDRNQYQRDSYNRSNQKNYRGNNRYDKTYENWRSTDTRNQIDSEKDLTDKDAHNKERKDRKSYNKDLRHDKALDDVSQRDRLTEQVNRGTLECLVCCERVRQIDKIWNCRNCYHIFHLRCITKWGHTSKDNNGWRCPACQNACTEIPSGYNCYCGKVYDPPYVPGDTAHGCGDMCAGLGIKPGCVHRCSLLCHPGPCPKCEALVSKHCNCGATTQMVKCSADTILVCTAVCSKLLTCGVHKCTKICHGGDCDVCPETIDQDCYCGKNKRTIPCNKMQYEVKQYSCDTKCDQLLSCGNHNCAELCHPDVCPPCVRGTDQIKTCPCGNSPLGTIRLSCLDPIPSCEKVCSKRYPLCGSYSAPHICQSLCHEGECPPCPLSTFVRCRCGHMSCEIKCNVLSDARCEKKCTKKRSCAKHKCNQLCCIDIDHICPLPCNHMLTCGQHRCEQTCHKGRCQPCWRTSFEELYCECGANVTYPPVPCGTKRPACSRPCSRAHDCTHEALHTCHSQPECPPCTVLTTKICYGGHEKRSTIPCHQKEFSCGLPCGKDLPCTRHKCLLPCHRGACLKEGQTCSQPCTHVRDDCGHACGLPCHNGPCPDSPCKETVKVTCQCGLRSSTRTCVDISGEYQRIATSLLASKMADMQLGHSIDINDIVGATARKQTLKTLECNDECRLIERNRRLAIGLQIRNPDLSAKLTPRYSDFMRQWAKKDTHFCQLVHDKLTELVQLAKQSKQKSRSYSFPSMNRDKRQFVHEYCEHFGCESAAYDSEPNRNVVGTAVRDKAWLPSCSLLELIQRESGQRKVPGPILNRPLGASKGVSDSVSLKINSSALKPTTSASIVAQSTSFAATKTPDSVETVDYFNFPPLNK